MISRRKFLVYLGVGTYGMLQRFSEAQAATFPLPRPKPQAPKFFKPIASSSRDELLIPQGFRYDIIASVGDAMNSKGPYGSESFGSDCDFTQFFPIDALQAGKSQNHGLLWVNHEYVKPLFISGYQQGTLRTAEQVQKEKLAVGGSIIEIKKDTKGSWKRVFNSKYEKRFTALYPEIDFAGPWKPKDQTKALGTLANCSGGSTAWSTVLTCEENFQLCNPPDGLGWAAANAGIREEHYGWVVEVDPFGELPPLKLTSLGRFCHENVSMTTGASGKLVAYMGDDSKDQYFYKFVSRESYIPTASRLEKRKLLQNGVLYVANFEKLQWIPLDLELNPALKEKGFTSQAEILSDARKAATAVKATPLDRPEDCEIHPIDKTVYIALTNNDKHGNLSGQIIRLVEQYDDAESTKFKFEIFLAGGAQSGLSSPDNLVFDKSGNLWVACDVSSSSLGKGAQSYFGNNGLHYVPTSGKSTGQAFQFASGPVEAELTGPCFSPDQKTLFLSVQHPGEESQSLDKFTSHWPTGEGIPKSSVVAITGKFG